MDKTQDALKAAQALVDAEQAMQPYQAEIHAFMQDTAPLDEAAEIVFEEWAMQLNATCKAFRQADIFYHREWSAEDFVQAAQLKIPVSPI